MPLPGLGSHLLSDFGPHFPNLENGSLPHRIKEVIVYSAGKVLSGCILIQLLLFILKSLVERN